MIGNRPRGEPVLKSYCDTDTLLNNIKRHEDEPKAQEELAALELLLAGRGDGYSMYRSHVALAELEKTADQQHREKLRADYEALDRIPNDEKLIGFHNQMDHLGTVSVGP